MTRSVSTGSLGAFLQASRSRLSPDEVDLGWAGQGTRRVPGLRREELALLAGVSVSYYTRLEQGNADNASPQVLDALARALRLTEDERVHLHVLAAPRATQTLKTAVPERVDPGLQDLLASVGDMPAMVLGRHRDILAWNRTGHALLAGHLEFDAVENTDGRPNATEMVFLDSHTAELYVDWNDKAAASVGHLRIMAAHSPEDPPLLELIGKLTIRSPRFNDLWSTHQIKPSNTADYRLHHPLVGALTVTLKRPRFGDWSVIPVAAAVGS